MDRELTPAIEDYLKVIWASGEWTDTPCTVGALARQLGLSPSSVSETIKRLAGQGLVEHEPYRGIRLTAAGEKVAVAMVRRHRILETYLVQTFGYSWDEVHDEAEQLEHAASDRLIDAMDEVLGHPTTDPHGDPIPRADGSMPPVGAPDLVPLTVLDVDEKAEIKRISDAEPELLRWCTEHGLVLGAHVRVVGMIPGAQQIHVEVAGVSLGLSATAAGALWVSREGSI